MKIKTQIRPHLELGFHSLLDRLIKQMIGLQRAEQIYEDIRKKHDGPQEIKEFLCAALEELGISFKLPKNQIEFLKNIQGPMVVIANHPSF
jgi:hypothetical protein